jgi:hypothetical protein
MSKVLAKATLIAGAVCALAQPVFAQSYQPEPYNADANSSDAAPQMRPYSEVEAEQRAYEQGRADEAEARAYAQGRQKSREQTYEDGERADGYCYQRKASARTSGTIFGAIAGGLIGNSLSNRWNRGGNTLGGAMIGGMMGRSLGDDSVQCFQDAYYSYDDGYYAPPEPPRGYVTVYFTSRPHYGYRNIYRGRHHHRHW